MPLQTLGRMAGNEPMRRKALCGVVAALLLPLLLPADARAESAPPRDMPAVLLPGTCPGLEFSRTLIAQPATLDLVIQVDATGKPQVVSPVTPDQNAALLALVVPNLMSCGFRPAMREGKPVPGVARHVQLFLPGPPAEPVARRPGIQDVKSCAPTEADYPEASIRNNESGTTRVAFTINEHGRVIAYGVVRSSGHFLLDITALIKLAQCRFHPGRTADGKPVSASFEVEYVWTLK